MTSFCACCDELTDSYRGRISPPAGSNLPLAFSSLLTAIVSAVFTGRGKLWQTYPVSMSRIWVSPAPHACENWFEFPLETGTFLFFSSRAPFGPASVVGGRSDITEWMKWLRQTCVCVCVSVWRQAARRQRQLVRMEEPRTHRASPCECGAVVKLQWKTKIAEAPPRPAICHTHTHT